MGYNLYDVLYMRLHSKLCDFNRICVHRMQESLFRRIIQSTLSRNKQHGPVLEIDRIRAKRSRQDGGAAGPSSSSATANASSEGARARGASNAGPAGRDSVFAQMASKLGALVGDVDAMLLPGRHWKVWKLLAYLKH